MSTKSWSGWVAFALLFVSLPARAWQRGDVAERRAAILETAERFATLRWRAEEHHAFHGDDAAGVRVDTPDVSFDPNGWRPGEENIGMPYAWGGFTSLESFDGELAAKRYAGHVPARGNARGSGETLGVDCSGFVSRCWGLPLKQSTRSLGALCYELADYGELQPGDIVNRFDAHVALFVGWSDEQRRTMQVVEAARLRVAEAEYTVDVLRSNDFRPMRYKLLDERWRPMPVPDAERDTVLSPAAAARFVAGGGAATLIGSNPDGAGADWPYRWISPDSRPGSWVRYDADETRLPVDGVACTWMAVEGAAGVLELQRLLSVGRDSVATGTTLDLTAAWPAALVAFGSFSNPLRDLELVRASTQAGTYRLGERELECQRLTAVVKGNMLSRSTLYPSELDIECVFSPEVPLFGLCDASLRFETNYGSHDGERVVGVEERRYTLTAFGSG